MNFTADELETCLKVLQVVADDTALMDGHERFKGLVAKIHRRAKKGKRSANHRHVRQFDKAVALRTGIVQQQFGGKRLTDADRANGDEYRRTQRCYVCKHPFVKAHFFYSRLCPDCAERNWAKRQQRTNLSGRIALVTGGRIKIGYQTTLKLLRDGARAVVTTRFRADALRRYRSEPDWTEWGDRLEVHALDLRDLPSVHEFAVRFLEREPALDVLVHNAAQTVKRPLAFYRHLLEAETSGLGALATAAASNVLVEARPGYLGHLPGGDLYFPKDSLDLDGQQVDRRPTNSWRQRLGDVDVIELLEVFLVSAIAPFMLSNHLLPALLRSPHPRRFIVNVSAMEGQYSRPTKNSFHPHTNMAKAALNMLTRTAAGDLAKEGVYLNSVDTGWITDERPLPQAEQLRDEHGFHLPLDAVDAAARIYDPIARGLNEPDEPLFGHFLKDYAPFPW